MHKLTISKCFIILKRNYAFDYENPNKEMITIGVVTLHNLWFLQSYQIPIRIDKQSFHSVM